jgi:hypothetical protein
MTAERTRRDVMGAIMTTILAGAALAVLATGAGAETVNFNADPTEPVGVNWQPATGGLSIWLRPSSVRLSKT